MRDNYNYPPGADTPDAPWNEPAVPEKDFELSVCQVLSKDVTVTTDDYNPEYDDETGDVSADTSDTNWTEAYNTDHFTPLQLIDLFKRYLEDELSHKGAVSKAPSYIKYLIAECSDWVEDELDIEEA